MLCRCHKFLNFVFKCVCLLYRLCCKINNCKLKKKLYVKYFSRNNILLLLGWGKGGLIVTPYQYLYFDGWYILVHNKWIKQCSLILIILGNTSRAVFEAHFVHCLEGFCNLCQIISLSIVRNLVKNLFYRVLL